MDGADVLRLGPVTLSRIGREVRVDGRAVALTATEFDLLQELMRHPGVALTREVLLDRVWGIPYEVATRTIDVHVGQLRRKLGRADLIRTVRGVGYKIQV